MAIALLCTGQSAIAQTVVDTTHHEEEKEMEEISISATRSTRTIADQTTRVEFIAGEELEEKANMKPGDIRMVLSESTGIQVQQTSVTTANASIRIQGLDGRYTQLLKDGFPLYSGAASGLGLLQTPPLDLKQVEVIKGSASTLYGGGAIAGLVNLVSKTPTQQRQLNFLVNGTTAGGLDINGYYSQRFGKTGVTLFAARNSNAPYDPASIDLTAIPKFTRYTINPKFYWYPNEKTTFWLGLNAMTENRMGGDLHRVRGDGDSVHQYYEQNGTSRLSAQLFAERRSNDLAKWTIRTSFAAFNRSIETPGYLFEGAQYSTFTELSRSWKQGKMEWVVGANAWTESFHEQRVANVSVRDYSLMTGGLFAQNIWQATMKLALESGLRGDYTIDYGLAVLPRLSLLYKSSNGFASRLGGGFGYKAPTPFTEETEKILYRNLQPVSSDRNKLERSYGANWDFNYRTRLFDGLISCTINQLFFYTRVDNPLLLQLNGTGDAVLQNANGHLDTRGWETNVKLGYKDFKLFLGYTFTDAALHTSFAKTENPLTPRHRINSILMWEHDEHWKVGLEAYYYSPQQLTDGSTGRDYWLCGFMAERLWERFSIYINFENFLDARQTRWDTIYTGNIRNPQFRDVYAPLDGFVVNGGLKLRL